MFFCFSLSTRSKATLSIRCIDAYSLKCAGFGFTEWPMQFKDGDKSNPGLVNGSLLLVRNVEGDVTIPLW